MIKTPQSNVSVYKKTSVLVWPHSCRVAARETPQQANKGVNSTTYHLAHSNHGAPSVSAQALVFSPWFLLCPKICICVSWKGSGVSPREHIFQPDPEAKPLFPSVHGVAQTPPTVTLGYSPAGRTTPPSGKGSPAATPLPSGLRRAGSGPENALVSHQKCSSYAVARQKAFMVCITGRNLYSLI